jgi:hypothetical protein
MSAPLIMGSCQGLPVVSFIAMGDYQSVMAEVPRHFAAMRRFSKCMAGEQ